MFLVKLSTMVKNRIHLIIDRHPEAKGQIDPSDLFGKQGLEWLKLVMFPKEDRRILDGEIELLEYLHEQGKMSIRALAKVLERDSSNVHQDVKILHQLGLILRDEEENNYYVPWSSGTQPRAINA